MSYGFHIFRYINVMCFSVSHHLELWLVPNTFPGAMLESVGCSYDEGA